MPDPPPATGHAGLVTQATQRSERLGWGWHIGVISRIEAYEGALVNMNSVSTVCWGLG